MYLNVSVYHGEYYVDGDEGPRASNASTTVDHHRPGVMYEVEERYILQYIKQFNCCRNTILLVMLVKLTYFGAEFETECAIFQPDSAGLDHDFAVARELSQILTKGSVCRRGAADIPDPFASIKLRFKVS